VRERPTFQERFTEMLDGADEAISPWLTDPTHIARLRVYRNNVVTAWADTIVKNYPAVERLVGTDFMRGAAIAFARAHPPQSPLLSLYGDAFPNFLEDFAPAASLPYLPDIARLDRAWTEAFFAANAPPLAATQISTFSDEEIGAMAPGLHPSVQILESRWNAWEIWKVNREDDEITETELKEAPTASVIWWSPDGIADRALSPGELSFLKAVAEGATLGNALKGREAEALAFFSEALAGGMFSSSLNT